MIAENHLRFRDVAAELRCTAGHLREIIDAGMLTPVSGRGPTSWRFRREDLQTFLRAHIGVPYYGSSGGPLRYDPGFVPQRRMQPGNVARIKREQERGESEREAYERAMRCEE